MWGQPPSAARQIDPKSAGLMLYGLQAASANLRHVKFEAEKPTDVVIDRKTVDQTCINGPQWFARDFADKVEEAGESEPVAASGGKVPAKPGHKEGSRGQAKKAGERGYRRGSELGAKHHAELCAAGASGGRGIAGIGDG